VLPTTPPDPLAPLVTAAVHGVLGTLLPLAIVLALLAAAAAWLKPHLKGAAGEAAVARRLHRLGFPCLHDVILPAQDGSLTQIDHVALTAQGLLAIETKTYAGSIFGQQNDRDWMQALGGRKSRFQNPLRQNFKHVAALRHHLRTDVQGLVVFAGTARFPKGLPPGVVTLATFAAHMDRLGRPTPAHLAGPAWQAACRLAERGRGQHQAHLAGLRARHAAEPRLAARLLSPTGLIPANTRLARLAARLRTASQRQAFPVPPAATRSVPPWPPERIARPRPPVNDR